MSSSPSYTPLNIAIVGAGIGGLATAAALCQQGHHVTVYEKSHFKQEVGAAIHLPPNACTLVQHLGMVPDRHGAINEEHVSQYNDDGTLLWTRELKAPFTKLIHRVDLHEGLKDAALKSGVEIVLGKAVKSVNAEGGVVEFVDGEKKEVDVILGADGIHSVVRTSVSPEEVVPTRNSMLRMLIPTSSIMQVEGAKTFMEKPGAFTSYVSGEDKMFVAYPCRNNELLNIGFIFHEDSMKPPVTPDQDIKARAVELASYFHENVQSLIALAPEVLLWKLYDIPNLSTWTVGKTTLLGDAAHSLLPFTGQGGAQAIEDAVTLGIFLPLGTRPEDVPARLKLFENTRRERVEWLQDYGRSMVRQAHGTPSREPEPWTEFYRRVFPHNAWDHAKLVIEQEMKARGQTADSTSPVALASQITA